jgi:hypothetical protein
MQKKSGWTSRKLILGGGVMVLGMVASTAAMFALKDVDGNPAVTFDQWCAFTWKLVGSVLVPLLPSMAAERIAEIKNGGGE